MGSNMLSQEEIDALLSMAAQGGEDSQPAATSLKPDEIDMLGEIGNISMGTAATTMSLLLNRRVQITIPRVSLTTAKEIGESSPMPFIVVEVGYVEGLQGRNLLVIRTTDGAVIADLMIGRDGSEPQLEIDDFVLSALAEAMNQMMGSAATSLSDMFNRTIVISPPVAKIIDLGHEPLDSRLVGDESLVKIAFSMTVEGLIDSEVMLLLEYGFAKNMLGLLAQPTPDVAATASVPPMSAVQPPQSSGDLSRSTPPAPARGPAPQPLRPTPPPAEVKDVEFQPLPQVAAFADAGPSNLQLLLDVPLQLTVELGRTRKTIKEVLDLVPGSIFELDRVAGEPVDIHVNGKLVAKGEVVVIDENFGVRITDIVSVIDRVTNLQ